jgi:glutamate racemase
LLDDEIATAYPGIEQVDGGAGIARRIAYLTRGQPWPDAPPPGIAVFTKAPPPSLGNALARFGIEEVNLL